jgi:DNA-binding response OmpR family regulator
MKSVRVLVLEDEEEWRKTIKMALADHEITHIQFAANLDEATALLGSTYFNIAIIDISMKQGDPKDSQGMDFLKLLKEHYLDQVVNPIVLSAYGSLERARVAFGEYKVIDFLEKAPFDDEQLMGAIRKALAEQGLDRHPTITIEGEQALPALWSAFTWAQREDPEQLEPELYDLLRRLFKGADSLFITPLKAGQSGAGILEVEPTYGAQVGEPMVIKFGKAATIRQEHENYAEHIEKYVGNHSSTQLNYASGRVMGAICYSLLGTELNTLGSFGDYYARQDLEGIKKSLDNLFGVTCRRWYNNKEQPRSRRNLVKLYTEGLHIVHPQTGEDRWYEIWENSQAMGVDLTQPRLRFPGLAGEFANPKLWLEEQHFRIFRPVWRSVTHGDLNERNILVTPDGRTWLIDFYRTGMGHILRDVVELETAIKFSLTRFRDLRAYYEFETLLLGQTRMDQPPEAEAAHPQHKAIATIGYMRILADNFTGVDKEMHEYYIALLLQTLNLLRLDGFQARRQQILLSASLVCGWLQGEMG